MGGGGGGGGFRNTVGGRANSVIHKGKQDKHIEGTNNYRQQVSGGKHPSILTEDPHALLKEGAGRGRQVNPMKEVVDFGRVIGKYYSLKTEKYYDTTRGTIHYDNKNNAHIVPAEPKMLTERSG